MIGPDKFVAGVGFAAAAALALGGCGVKPPDAQRRKETTYRSSVVQMKDGEDATNWANIFVDRATGCEYIGVFGGITPRLGVNGRPRCPTKTVVGKDGIEREAL